MLVGDGTVLHYIMVNAPAAVGGDLVVYFSHA